MKSIRVILADDHKLVRAGIRSLLEDFKGIIIVGEASNGREAIELTAKLNPDIVFLDLAMPELNGLETAARIRKEFTQVKCIILSMYTDEEYIIQALKSGASGYLLKDAAPVEMMQAVKLLMKGEIYISPSITSEKINEFIKRQKDFPLKEESISRRENLTARQKEVLKLIAEGNSTKEIAEKLFISVKTVETHRAQLMKKLGIYDIAGLVKYAIKTGLIFPEK